MTKHFKVDDVFVWLNKAGVREGSNGVPHICRVVEIHGDDLVAVFVSSDLNDGLQMCYPSNECTLLDDGSESLADIKRRRESLKTDYESIANQFNAVCEEEYNYYHQLYETSQE